MDWGYSSSAVAYFGLAKQGPGVWWSMGKALVGVLGEDYKNF